MYRCLNEFKSNESYLQHISDLSYPSKLKLLPDLFKITQETNPLRRSEYIGRYEHDIVYIDIDDISKASGLGVSQLKVKGNYLNFFENSEKYISYFGASIHNLNGLKGESVRYIIEDTEFTDQYFNTGITLWCDGEHVYGEIHLWSYFKKPYKYSKVCEFKYSKDTVEVNIIEGSLLNVNCVLSILFKESHESNDGVLNEVLATGCANFFEYFNISNEAYSRYSDCNSLSILIVTALNIFLHNHLSVVIGLGEYGEDENGKLVLGNSFQFYNVTGKQIPRKEYSGDYLEVGSEWYKCELSYLKLISEIAQLGSEIVVPRDEILDYPEFLSKYFKGSSDCLSLREEFIEELGFEYITDLNKYFIGFTPDRLENLYFAYVWNRLYFKVPQIWSNIRILVKGVPDFIIRYDKIYNTLELEHQLENNESVFFRGDVDLKDLNVKVFASNFVLNSLRPEIKFVNFENLVILFYELAKDEIKNYFSDNPSGLSYPDVEVIVYQRSELELLYNTLLSMNYSKEELLNLMFISDPKMLKNTVIAGEIEDYSCTLINYIMVLVLIAEKDKIAQALEELQEESDEETPDEVIEELGKSTELVEVSKKGERVTYVFNGTKVNRLNKVLGYHLKRRKAKFRYTTPYWVRRGHYKTLHGGERVWIEEQICKRDPALLSIRVDEEEPSAKVYKLTNLFK